MSVYSVELLYEVDKYIKALPPKAKDKVLFRIDQLEKHGLGFCKASPNVVEKVSRNLYVLRIKVRDFFCRIFFTFRDSIIWLILAYNKKSNKIPTKIIRLAQARQKELGY